MSLFLTQLAADNFQRANESPLKSPPWSRDSRGNPGLQIVNDVCEVTATNVPCAELYSGISLPNDQYASIKIAAAPSGFSPVLRIGVRKTDNGAQFLLMPGYVLDIFSTWALFASGSLISSGSLSTISAGDIFTIAAIGTTIVAFQNGVQFGSVTDATYSSGSAGLFANSLSLSDVQLSNFSIGSASTTQPHYSEPDCRITPNAARILNGTLVYDVQFSSNPAIPPTDSRAAGAPVASGVYPQNSRTSGTFGPGE